MAKQIIVTQGDYGIVFNIELLSENGDPIELLSSDIISADMQYPSGECLAIEREYITILDRKKGIIRFILGQRHTEEEGYHQVFIELTSSSYKVNAKKAVGYYVNAKHGIGNH